MNMTVEMSLKYLCKLSSHMLTHMFNERNVGYNKSPILNYLWNIYIGLYLVMILIYISSIVHKKSISGTSLKASILVFV